MIQELAFTARFCCKTKVFFRSVSESDHRPGGGGGEGGGCFTPIEIGTRSFVLLCINNIK